MEIIRWWHIVLVFIVIELWGWAEKQPRLYIRTSGKLYLKSKLKPNWVRTGYVFSTTQDISRAISFFILNPIARIQLRMLQDFEDDWEIKRMQYISDTQVGVGIKNKIKKLIKK